MVKENIKDIIKQDVILYINTLERYIKYDEVEKYLNVYERIVSILRYTIYYKDFSNVKCYEKMNLQELKDELKNIKNFIINN